jgi:hypothetical protein
VLVEGPPDMIAARSCGLAAIAVPGTSAWQPAWAEQLTGKHITLVMDCDPPGRAAAAKIAASLSLTGIRVDVVDLAPGRSDGYDLTDRILEPRCKRTGPLNARAVAALLRPIPTFNHTRTRARARNTQEVAR